MRACRRVLTRWEEVRPVVCAATDEIRVLDPERFQARLGAALCPQVGSWRAEQGKPRSQVSGVRIPEFGGGHACGSHISRGHGCHRSLLTATLVRASQARTQRGRWRNNGSPSSSRARHNDGWRPPWRESIPQGFRPTGWCLPPSASRRQPSAGRGPHAALMESLIRDGLGAGVLGAMSWRA